VLVFAAASMKPALDRLAPKFESGQHVKMTISYAATSALALQIQNGAPADLFIAADLFWADKVEGSGHASKRADFLGNGLVLVVPATAGELIKRPEDLAADAVKRVAIGDPDSVPAGKYAKEALTTLKLWDRTKAKMVPAMDVRQALLYVERGEADAGIVYGTDAKSSKAVRVVATLDGSLKRPIRYALVLVKRDGRSLSAETGYDFLLSDRAMREFESAGFMRLPDTPAAPGK
jgi:molybdate transport system substrate-binding protein